MYRAVGVNRIQNLEIINSDLFYLIIIRNPPSRLLRSYIHLQAVLTTGKAVTTFSNLCQICVKFDGSVTPTCIFNSFNIHPCSQRGSSLGKNLPGTHVSYT